MAYRGFPSARAGKDVCVGLLGGDLPVLDLRGVEVDVVLPGQLLDGRHRLVRHVAQHLGVAWRVVELAEVERLADEDDRAPRPGKAEGPLDRLRPRHTDGDHGNLVRQRHAGHAGLALVEPAVG